MGCGLVADHLLRGQAHAGSIPVIPTSGLHGSSLAQEPWSLRVWSSGRASAFQADERGSTPLTRSTQVLDAEAVEATVCKTVLMGFESPRALHSSRG